MTRELRCPTGHVIGVMVGPAYAGLVSMRHHGRESIGVMVCIRCERCGECWRPDAPRLPLDDLEVKAPTLMGRR